MQENQIPAGEMRRHNGVEWRSDPVRFAELARLYGEVRRRESRLLTDQQVGNLPSFDAGAPALRREWRWRARSLKRLLRYLRRRPATEGLRILDLGCGNGWMALHLARLPGAEVWAVDVHLPELEQGARVAAAAGLSNIHFIFADIFEGVLPEHRFDTVVMAASVQYFPDLRRLIPVLRNLLNPGGEIHLLDSPFYPDETRRAAARARTHQYYAALGVPDMAAHYHHHCWSDIRDFGAENRNGRFWPRLLQKLRFLGPFPWVHV